MEIETSAPLLRKPSWLRVKMPSGQSWADMRHNNCAQRLSTVCEEAACPNMGECWGRGVATFMILGDVCTRGCRFCNVRTSARGRALDPEEPRKVAETARALKARYVVLTSVDRDDLPDGGARHFVDVVKEVAGDDARIKVEILTPDFAGKDGALETVAASPVAVLGHNIETVARLTPKARDPRATYEGSLGVLRTYRRLRPDIPAKSSILLGIGETEEEILQTMRDLREADVDILTLGQYLQPTRRHLAVERYYSPDEFEEWRRRGEDMGFVYVASGPLVRSSYRAEEAYICWRERQ